MEGDAEKGSGRLIGNAPGIEDRTAPDTFRPGYIHHILSKAGIDDP